MQLQNVYKYLGIAKPEPSLRENRIRNRIRRRLAVRPQYSRLSPASTLEDHRAQGQLINAKVPCASSHQYRWTGLWYLHSSIQPASNSKAFQLVRGV